MNNLGTQRIIWAALLLGPAIFFLLIVLVIWPGQHAHDSDIAQTLLYVDIAMLLTLVPMGFVIRQRMPGQGNVVFWAICEGISFVGLVGMMQHGSLWPNLIVPNVATAMHLISFPADDD